MATTSLRMETQRLVDASDRVHVVHELVCNGCGARFVLSKKTARARAMHACPEKP